MFLTDLKYRLAEFIANKLPKHVVYYVFLRLSRKYCYINRGGNPDVKLATALHKFIVDEKIYQEYK